MPWQPPRHDRKKAAALVVALHIALGAALISGLAARPIRHVTEALTTFDVTVPPPPPPMIEPPKKAEAAAKREVGAPDLEAKPAPVVLPPPVIPLPQPSPLPTADESAPVTGAAASAGAGQVAGPGRGANGTGSGTGGGGNGGTGAGSGLGSEARLISGNLTRSDYRRIRSFGALRGQATLAIEVSVAGQLSRCMPLSSSGDPALDQELCRLLGRTRWLPARDRNGQAVPVALRYVATWDRD
jgi:protein TonB